MIKILIAEDHHIVRQGLRAILERQPDFEIVGETGEGTQVSPLVRVMSPDVLVADVMMPGLNGLEIARLVHERHPNTKVVILSMHADESYVLQALRNHASGYVLKDSGATELVHAIREVTQGNRYLSPRLAEKAIDSYVQASQGDPTSPYEKLTSREREVLHLVAEGHSSREIASILSISPRTVESHRANMMEKLSLENQTDLIRFAIQRGIIPLER
jgi:DNA-binding NarL/FixJ family response regulator